MSRELLVIGASSDLGCRFIERNIDKYDRVAAHYFCGNENLKKLIKQHEDKIVPLQADLCSFDSVKDMVNTIKEQNLVFEHVVHLAADKIKNLRFHQSTREDFVNALECSLLSFTEILKPTIVQMAKNKNGKIVVMLTAYTQNIPPKFLSPYIVSKYAMLGLVKSLASDYGVKGININAVSPEMIDTKYLADLPELLVEMNKENSIAGRNLFVDEVVPTIEYLLSDAADMVTGQNILISGVKRF